jgi:hypothetical protein
VSANTIPLFSCLRVWRSNLKRDVRSEDQNGCTITTIVSDGVLQVRMSSVIMITSQHEKHLPRLDMVGGCPCVNNRILSFRAELSNVASPRDPAGG